MAAGAGVLSQSTGRRPRLTARGERVHVRPVEAGDLGPYQAAVEASWERIARWNPVNPGRLTVDLGQQSDTYRTFVVRAIDPGGAHGLVARINLSNVVHGAFHSGTLGYDAYDPYAGRGLFREGMALVLDVLFRASADGGLGLHRVEANVQPANVRSAAVLRGLGFRHEGETPRMLLLRGPDGTRWRDHERYAVTAQEWPAPAYPAHARRRRVLLVNGRPGTGRSVLAEQVAAELALPLVTDQAVGHQAGDALWALLAGCPTGAVLESWWPASDAAVVDGGLRRAGIDPAAVVELWCDSPLGGRRVDGPLGLGPSLRVDVSRPANTVELVQIALRARALADGGR
ncbi:MAG: GNAT family N-acetyltransferase [Angustibacter sp.]